MPIDITLDAQRVQTQNLIDTEGQDITLWRPPALIDDGAGGKKRSATVPTRLSQRRRYFAGLTTMGRGVSTQPERWYITPGGEKYKAYFVLIGLWDDDIQEDDYFFLNEKRYDVLFVHDNIAYQIKAEVGLTK